MIQCPSCGGGLRFDIESQQMACDYCGSHFEPKEVDTTSGDSKEIGYDAYDVAVHICPSCGAELLTNDQNDAVGFCPFCGGASMIFSQIRQQWKPEVILPFRVTKEQCKEAYLKEARKSPFVSNRYRQPDLTESFRGIYMPYWIIDTEYDGEYELKLTTKENDTSSGYDVCESVFEGSANGTSRYVHDASLNFSDDISEALSPYPVKESKRFSAGYLCGFYTEISDISEEEYKEQIDEIVTEKQSENLSENSEIRKELTLGASITDASMEKKLVPQKMETTRALFPVWFMSNKKKDKVTYAAVNGVNGKIAVDLPLSPVKILITALLIGAAAFLMSFILPTIKAVECLLFCAVLMMIGILTIESAYTEVLQAKLRADTTIKKKSGFGRIAPLLIALIASVFAINIYIASSTGPFILLMMMVYLIPFCIIVIISSVKKRNKLSAEMKKPGNIKYKASFMQEARKYKRIKWVFNLIAIIFVAAAVVIVVLNPPAALYMYAMCVLMVVNLFTAALMHIRFQVALSMRRPPQMNKKGALYDEN